MTVIPEPAIMPEPATHKNIGIWGAPGSGKTTFLAALYFAVTRSPQKGLSIFGTNELSNRFIVQSTHDLTTLHAFPAATEAPNSLSLNMSIENRISPLNGRRLRTNIPGTAGAATQFRIGIDDMPSRFFWSTNGDVPVQNDPGGTLQLGDEIVMSKLVTPRSPAFYPGSEVIDHMAGCAGVLILVDPIREREYADTHQYIQGILLGIAQRRLEADPQQPLPLPHYVAVCVTKFDDNRVFGFAQRNGFRMYDADDRRQFPRVPEDEAEHFFRELCGESGTSDPDLLHDALPRYFDPGRIKYFVTSSIGFYSGPETGFIEEDCENTVRQDDGSVRIRGKIHPINVLEPMLWLSRCVNTKASE